MEGRPAECLLAGSMVGEEVLEEVVRDGIKGSSVGKKEREKEKGLGIGVQGQEVCEGRVVGVWGEGGEVRQA